MPLVAKTAMPNHAPIRDVIPITKQALGSARIDPLTAAFNGIALMATNPGSAQPSITWI